MKYTIATIIAVVGQTCTAAPVAAHLPPKGMSLASDLRVGWEDGTTKPQRGLVQIPKMNFANVKQANAIRSLGRRDNTDGDWYHWLNPVDTIHPLGRRDDAAWEDGNRVSPADIILPLFRRDDAAREDGNRVSASDIILPLGRRDQNDWDMYHSSLLDYGDQLWDDLDRATAQLSKECYDRYEIESDVNDCEETEFTKVYWIYARLNQDVEWKLRGGAGSGTVDLHMPKGADHGGVITNWKRDSEEWKAKQKEYEKEEDRLQAAENREKQQIHDDLVVGKFNTDTYGDLKDDIEEKYDALQDELNFLQRGGAHPKTG